MKKVIGAVLMTLLLVGAAQAEMVRQVHLIVIPKAPAPGLTLEQALIDLKTELARLAGGYTDLGDMEGGWLTPQGMLEVEKNCGFMVSASKSLVAELEEYIPKKFDVEKPYILVWQAASTY